MNQMTAAHWPDRVCAPSVTLTNMAPALAGLGITRVGKQTNLDVIGIPSFAAFRPNAAFLSVNQGKGLDDESAMVSAIMEAAEYAIAERPVPADFVASIDEMQRQGISFLSPGKWQPSGANLANQQLQLCVGRDLHTGSKILVPIDAVRLGHTTAGYIAQTTNGLASGNNLNEAVFHAVCELVERDATSISSLFPAQRNRCFDPCDLHDPAVDELVGKISAAGFALTLFDQTTDLAIPCVMAALGRPDEIMHLGVTAGYGCHPGAARAAVRAITEAAQSRITNIAGSRDDYGAEEYRRRRQGNAGNVLLAVPNAPPPQDAMMPPSSLAELLSRTLVLLEKRGIGDLVAVDLPTRLPFSVVKVLSRLLEDRDANPNWRPSIRTIMHLRAAA